MFIATARNLVIVWDENDSPMSTIDNNIIENNGTGGIKFSGGE